jgi:hypothetical protein
MGSGKGGNGRRKHKRYRNRLLRRGRVAFL